MVIAALTGLRMTEIVSRVTMEVSQVTHTYTDNAYWCYCTGILIKKPKEFKGYDKPLLERHSLVASSIQRLRNIFFLNLFLNLFFTLFLNIFLNLFLYHIFLDSSFLYFFRFRLIYRILLLFSSTLS